MAHRPNQEDAMKGYELQKLGIPKGEMVQLGLRLLGEACENGADVDELRDRLEAIAAEPDAHVDDEHFGHLAQEMVDGPPGFVERDEPARWKSWGEDLDPGAIGQMENACRLPVAVRGALMPDAHRGYGLPIGGVLAAENAVIPYAVGVDIACRMKLTVLDLPVASLSEEKERLIGALERETRFGIGASFQKRHRREHAILDEDWDANPVTKKLKDRAWKQLGSSGSGNHFVEFGTLEFAEDDLGLKAGTYVALLSHSGSRGPGARVASHYSKLARELHPELPKQLQHLAWLDMDSAEGQEYWHAMNMMGRFAAANHEKIHEHIAEALGVDVLADVENHHNFAWKEEHDGKEVIVHRKGATPAGKGILGIIPGSMADPGYVVRGKGEMLSLESASHGAGRVMSRTKAKKKFSWSAVQKQLDGKGVTLLSAGLDESPGVYKDIDRVMELQSDLVDVVAKFEPKLVKMAPSGEPPED
jgi:tRNA-splicing ligase RtcB